jgi:hypothetical protein
MSQYNFANAGSTLASSRGASRTWRRNQNTVRFRVGRTLGPIAHTVVIALLLAVLGLIYLTQITKTSTYGYDINKLETKRTELLSQKQDLEVENARLQALERVSESGVAKALDKPTTVEYAQN